MDKFISCLNLSTESLLTFILIMVVITFIISLMTLILMFGLRNSNCFIYQCLTESISKLTTDMTNIVTGSKRVEKMCDAINQRTKAHLVQPKKSTSEQKVDKRNDRNRKRVSTTGYIGRTASGVKRAFDKSSNLRGKNNDKNQNRTINNDYTIIDKQ